MDQAAGEAVNVLLQSGILGVIILGLGAFVWFQNRQIREMHAESMVVQKDLTRVLRDNTSAYVRLCEMLNDRPCLHQASALSKPQGNQS